MYPGIFHAISLIQLEHSMYPGSFYAISLIQLEHSMYPACNNV